MTISAEDIGSLGAILGIWAHPDDEAWSTSGIMAAAVANGQRVACVVATLGDAGETADEARWPKDRLGSIREDELRAAMKVYGVSDLELLGYPDGKLSVVDETEATKRLVRIISEFKPDTIFTFEPNGITGHPDHQTVCQWTCAAVSQTKLPIKVYAAVETEEDYEEIGKACDKAFNVYFATEKPFTMPCADLDLCFKLDDNLHKKKLAALKSHASQVEGLLSTQLGQTFAEKKSCQECFMRLHPEDTLLCRTALINS